MHSSLKLKFLLLGLGLSSAFISFTARAVERGEEVFRLCTYCHGPQGEGNPRIAAPSIAGLPEWYLKRQLLNFRSGVRGAHPKDPAGMRMYPMARTLNGDSDIEAVAKHVAALPRRVGADTVKGQVIKGQNSYKLCISCHGSEGEGNETLNAPPLAGLNDWYLLTQLKNFKGHVRAGNPSKDPIGAAMSPMAAGLSDEDMLNVVSYINTFKYKKAIKPQSH